jgi:hypothetical protein
MVSLRSCTLIVGLVLLCFSSSALAIGGKKDKKAKKSKKGGEGKNKKMKKDSKPTSASEDNIVKKAEVCSSSVLSTNNCSMEGYECLHMKACCCGSCNFLGSCSCNDNIWQCFAVGPKFCLDNCPDEEVIFADPPPESSFGCPSAASFPQVVGLSGTKAKAVIEEEEPCLYVEIIPEGSFVTTDYRIDRVRIFVNGEGVVEMVPLLG